jgi:AbiJ N-terminal domain 4
VNFSQRNGFLPAVKLAQYESMDDDLRASLWSLLSIYYWDKYKSNSGGMYNTRHVRGSNFETLITMMWLDYFKLPIDKIDQHWDDCLNRLRTIFFEFKWNEVYDFVEFVAEHRLDLQKNEFIDAVNTYLERENAAYCFISGKICEITSADEIAEVEAALSDSIPYAGVKTHLTTALALLSDRNNPDYRNSIKESISAVEALAKQLSGNSKGTLGSILGKLESAKKLHPALSGAFSALFGYTSDADGIRHALHEKDTLTKADARFMLVCCSAFVNYAVDTIKPA